jgi:hypothetical protein
MLDRLLDHRELLDLKGLLVHREMSGHKGILGLLDQQDLLDLLDQLGQQDRPVPLEYVDHKVLLAQQLHHKLVL